MKHSVTNPKPQKNQWVVVFGSGTVANWTIAYTKKASIENYLRDVNWVKDKDAYWKEQYKMGTRCIKVNITFQIIEK